MGNKSNAKAQSRAADNLPHPVPQGFVEPGDKVVEGLSAGSSSLASRYSTM